LSYEKSPLRNTSAPPAHLYNSTYNDLVSFIITTRTTTQSLSPTVDAETRQNEKGQQTGYSSNLYRTVHNDGNNEMLVKRQSEDRTRHDSREEQLGNSYNIRNQR